MPFFRISPSLLSCDCIIASGLSLYKDGYCASIFNSKLDNSVLASPSVLPTRLGTWTSLLFSILLSISCFTITHPIISVGTSIRIITSIIQTFINNLFFDFLNSFSVITPLFFKSCNSFNLVCPVICPHIFFGFLFYLYL